MAFTNDTGKCVVHPTYTVCLLFVLQNFRRHMFCRAIKNGTVGATGLSVSIYEPTTLYLWANALTSNSRYHRVRTEKNSF